MAVINYKEDDKQRLDIFMAQQKPKLSRSYISTQISSGGIKVNGRAVKTGYRLKSGDKISYVSLNLSEPRPKTIDLPILYEDDFCIVINKPSGIITHAKGFAASEGSVASFIAPKIKFANLSNRSGIVHRLDRGTSGVIITAKTEAASKYLQSQFAKRQTRKTYLAIISGRLEHDQAAINMPIERNPKHPSTFRTGINGKPALTEYEVIKTNSHYSLVKLTPKTGRTHQLRVHLNALNHPIVGDNFYNGEAADRLMLHAYALEVILPDIGRKQFRAPLPDEFKKYFKNLPKEL